MNKLAVVIVIGLIILVGGIVLWYDVSKAPGTPVPPINQTSTPPQNGTSSPVEVLSPHPGEKISSPVKVIGRARGMWFFEASFPVKVLDGDGAELGIAPVQAVGEWMTEEFVPFEGKVVFKTPRFTTGTLVFKKDNPSGLPEHDDEFRLPVRFASIGADDFGKKCFIGGCSSQVCSDREDVTTTCEFRKAYACYRTAKCERQPSGECGWTQTAELKACIENSRDGAGPL